MAGDWPRLTKTPEDHLNSAGSRVSPEEQRAYEAAVAKASSWVSSAADQLQVQAPTGSSNQQRHHHHHHHQQQQQQHSGSQDEYSMRLDQLRASAAVQARPSAATAAMTISQQVPLQGRALAGQYFSRQPSWGDEPSMSQQGSPVGLRGPAAQLQWAAASSKSPPLGPGG